MRHTLEWFRKFSLWFLIVMKQFNSALHCVKSVHIRSYSGPYFPAFEMNSAKMRENVDQNNPKYGHFSLSVSMYPINIFKWLFNDFFSFFICFFPMIMSLTFLYVTVIESRYRKRFIVFFLCYPKDVLTILTLKNLCTLLNSVQKFIEFKVGCFWRFSCVYTIN